MLKTLNNFVIINLILIFALLKQNTMNNLESLKKSYQCRLINLKYNYATELLENISDATYAEILDSHEDLFSPISSHDADEYLHQPNVLDAIIEVLETAIVQQAEQNEKKHELLSYLNKLNKDQLDKVFYFIDKNF